MRKALIQRVIHIMAHGLVYLLLYHVTSVVNEMSLSQDPKGMYLFGWTVHNKYWYIWVVSLALALIGSKIWAWTITFGNLAGVVIGQFLGDLLYQLGFFHDGFHPGFRIWILFVLASFAIGGVSEILSLFAKLIDFLFRKKRRGKYLKRRGKRTRAAGKETGTVAVEQKIEAKVELNEELGEEPVLEPVLEPEMIPADQSEE